MKQINNLINFIQQNTKSFVLFTLIVLLFLLGCEVSLIVKDIIIGELISKDFVKIYSDVKVSFYSILLLKNSALIFLLLFFMREYTANQRQYFQYKFKKNVVYNLNAVEEKFFDKTIDEKIREFSFNVYKDVIYKEPHWDKKATKEQKDK